MTDNLAFYVCTLRKDFVKYCNSKLEHYQLSEGIFYYLIYIEKKPDCTLSQISCHMKVDNAHTSRSIAKLEQLGYLKRTLRKADKRSIHLSLSEQGLHVYQELKNLLVEWDHETCSSLNDEDRRQLLYLLQTITGKRW